ncbi:MAG: FadR family transcriptional regulator [Rhizobiaceae bacterium]|nr:FadR family transcriptional regulator [Rhizobiaceae bacterium]
MENHPTVFRPVNSQSVVDAVVEQFEEFIVSGVLREGMKLPSERELSARFSVSREKLRDALQVLEKAGLVTARQGDGTYIAQLTGSALSPAMVTLYGRHARGFEDYLEYRREIEGFVARLAATRATRIDKEMIAECLERQAAAFAKADRDAALKEDVIFHTLIADAAHNSMVRHTTASLYELTEKGIFYNRQAMREMQSSDQELLRQHQAIAEAVFAGSGEAALAASNAHIDYVSAAVREARAALARDDVARNRQTVSQTTGARRRAG